MAGQAGAGLIAGIVIVAIIGLAVALFMGSGGSSSGVRGVSPSPFQLARGGAMRLRFLDDAGAPVAGAVAHVSHEGAAGATRLGTTDVAGELIYTFAASPLQTSATNVARDAAPHSITVAHAGSNEQWTWHGELSTGGESIAATEAAPVSMDIQLQGWQGLGATAWPSLRAAATAVREGEDALITVTYSFIRPGVHVATTAPGEARHSVVLRDHVDGSISEAQFQAQVRAAFAQWRGAFAAALGPGRLTVAFEEVQEPEDAPPLFGDRGSDGIGHAAASSVGDIRIGMWGDGFDPQVLACAYAPPHADMLFNASVDWRLDADVDDTVGGDGGFSVMYVAVHEIGHVLGFGHNATASSVMAPTAGRRVVFATKFSAGLGASVADTNGIRGVYANRA